jgi:hypothetical protein
VLREPTRESGQPFLYLRHHPVQLRRRHGLPASDQLERPDAPSDVARQLFVKRPEVPDAPVLDQSCESVSMDLDRLGKILQLTW